ncbi:YdcF family protein [Ponticoccus litoralis]|uniref:YdcF family protein n=1 Tax=Ponticoccus litoralis TaxID=422297 RepID=A0AAW9SCG6_9RHOB
MILLPLRLCLAYVLLCAVLGFGSAFVVPSCASVTGARDVALVLGAGIRKDGTLSPDSATRTEAGAELYRRGLVSAVHLSGGGAVGGTTIAETMARHAMDHGVPESALSSGGPLSVHAAERPLFLAHAARRRHHPGRDRTLSRPARGRVVSGGGPPLSGLRRAARRHRRP